MYTAGDRLLNEWMNTRHQGKSPSLYCEKLLQLYFGHLKYSLLCAWSQGLIPLVSSFQKAYKSAFLVHKVYWSRSNPPDLWPPLTFNLHWVSSAYLCMFTLLHFALMTTEVFSWNINKVFWLQIRNREPSFHACFRRLFWVRCNASYLENRMGT